MNAPLVSVVVPTYNRPALLAETLASVTRQTLGDLEVLVCDDGDGAETEGAVASLGDTRVRYLRNPTNLGQALNVRGGFRAARGRYVSLLHDDDLLEPFALERLVGGLEAHPDAVLAFGDHWIMDGDGHNLVAESDRITARYGRDRLAAGFHGPFQRIALVDLSIHFGLGTTYRKAALDLDDYPAEAGDYCDRWLGYLACRGGGGAYYVPERVSRYRQHGAQISHQGGRRWAESAAYCYDRLVSDPRLMRVRDDLAPGWRFAQYALGVELLWAGDAPASRRHLTRGFAASPAKAAVGVALSTLPAGVVRTLSPFVR